VFSPKILKMDDQLGQKILAGNASEKEKEVFYNGLEENGEAKAEFIKLKGLWDLYHVNQYKLSGEKKRKLFRELQLTIQGKNKKTISRRLPNVIKYAAVALLALLSGFYLHTIQRHEPAGMMRELHSENGSISSVVLTDGSKIWLNANTTLKIREEKRKVTATLSGEAYFDIRHDTGREFIVDLGKIKVKDLGTKFNISAYPEELFCRATLVAGDITILNTEGKAIKELAVNQTFRFNQEDSSFGIEELDPSIVTGWTSNKFVFIDKPLSEICREFEKWYGVSFRIDGEQLKQEKYTSVIRRTTTVAQLLEMFKLTTGINYTLKNEKNGNVTVLISK
jgi:transmembrane sensor